MNVLNRSMLALGSSFFMLMDYFLRGRMESGIKLNAVQSAMAYTASFSDDDHKLRVMTFNIRHGSGLSRRLFRRINLEQIAEEIYKAGASVVALQEVDRYLSRSGKVDQVAVLASMLGMEYSYGASLRLGKRQYGNAILSRFPIIEQQVHPIHSTIEQRSLLTATIQSGERRLTIFNTHLGLSGMEKRRQLVMITRLLRQIEGPVVLTGDFNMESHHPLLSMLPQSLRKMALQQQEPTYYRGGEIDHIYTNMEVAKERAWTQPTRASDHYPVVAELLWK